MSNSGGKKITLSLAKKMIQNYSQQAESGATKSVWYSTEMLAEALGLTVPAGHNISGLAFQFAAYDPSMTEAGIAATNKQTTLVVTPTQLANGTHVLLATEANDGPVYNDGTLCPPNCPPPNDLD